MNEKSSLDGLLTVGVPVYNGGKYIDNCLSALTSESFDFSIIISDNSSTDITEDICRNYARRDSRITYIRQDSNIGAEENYWFLLNQCKTPYFAFRSADDYSSVDYLKNLLIRIISDNSELSVGSRVMIDEKDGRIIEERPFDLNDFENRPLFELAKSHWYYGVHRHDVVLRNYRRIRENYPSPWGSDFLLLIPYLITDRISTDFESVFYQTITTASDDRYRPKKVLHSVILILQFWYCGWHLSKYSCRNTIHRLFTLLKIVKYANYRVEKYSRILKRVIIFPYYMIR